MPHARLTRPGTRRMSRCASARGCRVYENRSCSSTCGVRSEQHRGNGFVFCTSPSNETTCTCWLKPTTRHRCRGERAGSRFVSPGLSTTCSVGADGSGATVIMRGRSVHRVKCATGSSTCSPTGRSTAPTRRVSTPAHPHRGFEVGHGPLPTSRDGTDRGVPWRRPPNGSPAPVGNDTASSRPPNVQGTLHRRPVTRAADEATSKGLVYRNRLRPRHFVASARR
jgi:hypothetical protein